MGFPLRARGGGGTPFALMDPAVNWLLDAARWTWLTLTFLIFVAIECVAIYYLYEFLGWL